MLLVQVEVVENMMIELDHGSGVVDKLKEEVNRETTKHMVRSGRVSNVMIYAWQKSGAF